MILSAYLPTVLGEGLKILLLLDKKGAEIMLDLPMLRRRAKSLDKTITLSLHILQLPLGELEGYLLQKSKENPMLEVSFTGQPLEYEELPQEQWVEEFSWGDRVFWNYSNTWYQEEIPGWSSLLAPPLHPYDLEIKKTFTQQLVDQLKLNPLIPTEYLHHCIFLAESLDSRGYFTEDLSQTAQLLNIPETTAEQALYLLQEMQPTGVGARSLRECLLLQLAKSPYFNEHTLTLISQQPSAFSPLDYQWISELLGISITESMNYWHMVRGFNPIPTSGYREEQSYVVPEATIYVEEGELQQIFHHEGRMTVQLNKAMVEQLEEEKDTILSSYQKINKETTCHTIEALEKRNLLLESIISFLVSYQKEYFLKENHPLEPIGIGELATILEVNPTWVSRAICDKYIATPHGLLSLKSLLSHKTFEESEKLDREQILSRIRLIVEGEDKTSPLSDAKLQTLLEGFGIYISRRTITKYRSILGIESTSKRKHRQ